MNTIRFSLAFFATLALTQVADGKIMNPDNNSEISEINDKLEKLGNEQIILCAVDTKTDELVVYLGNEVDKNEINKQNLKFVGRTVYQQQVEFDNKAIDGDWIFLTVDQSLFINDTKVGLYNLLQVMGFYTKYQNEEMALLSTNRIETKVMALRRYNGQTYSYSSNVLAEFTRTEDGTYSVLTNSKKGGFGLTTKAFIQMLNDDLSVLNSFKDFQRLNFDMVDEFQFTGVDGVLTGFYYIQGLSPYLHFTRPIQGCIMSIYDGMHKKQAMVTKNGDTYVGDVTAMIIGRKPINVDEVEDNKVLAYDYENGKMHHTTDIGQFLVGGTDNKITKVITQPLAAK